MWLASSLTPETDPDLPVVGRLNVLDESGSFEAIAPPDNCVTLYDRPSYATWVRGSYTRTYIFGGNSANLVFTEHKKLLRLSIAAPTNPIVSGSGTGNEIGITTTGTGLTGNYIFAIRWRDSIHGRRSPLSAPSPTLALVNQNVALNNLPLGPTPTDSGVDVLEVWASQDGGLFRHLASRDIGATSITIYETVAGEAETSDLQAFPLCKYGRIYHDQLVMAGDARHPDRVYFSIIGSPEEYEGLWIATRNGEPVIGLYVIRDILIVQCHNSHYYVQGFDASDITMNTLEPFIGGLGHHTVVLLDRYAIFPARTGWYLCNGTSITLISQKFSITWAEEEHWIKYNTGPGQDGWCMHDIEDKLIKYKAPRGSVLSPRLGLQSVNGYTAQNNIIWVLDYSGLVDSNGGIELMFDTADGTAELEPTASAIYEAKDGTRKLYTGHANGKIGQDNVHGMNDLNHNFAYCWQTPHVEIAQPGDDADCASVVKSWLHVSNEDVDLEWTIYAGNGYDWQAEPVRSMSGSGGRQVTGTIAAGVDTVTYVDGTADKVYRDRVFLNAEATAGNAVSILLYMPPDGSLVTPHPAYSYAPTRSDSAVFDTPLIIIKGWGFTYNSKGEHARSIRPYAVA